MFIKLLAASVLLAGTISSVAIAKTPDGMTPSQETVCNLYKDMKGPAFGLCNSYCEARDCGDPNQSASNRSCSRTNDIFEKKVGYRLPEGFNAVDENGNWINNCLLAPDDNLDFGDAPGSYGDATHIILESNNPYIGDDAPDSETEAPADDGLAMGDDNTGEDDEGISVDTVDDESLICGDKLDAGSADNLAIVPVTGDGFLNVWADWNSDGAFSDGDEHIIVNAQPEAPGLVLTMIDVPADANSAFVRLRYSSEADLGPNGPAPDGEVEDCVVTVNPVN